MTTLTPHIKEYTYFEAKRHFSNIKSQKEEGPTNVNHFSSREIWETDSTKTRT